MQEYWILGCILGYFLVLLLISKITSKNTDKDSFYLGNKKSPWYLVAFGMIGASLSGVTFISVPGEVGTSSFTYLQMVFGFVGGYIVVAEILMPLYYKLNLVSIYTYLQERFGPNGYLTGSIFFLLSRTIGAAFRLFLVAIVLHNYVLSPWQIPFWLSVALTIAFIYLYSFKSGIKTIVYTDTIQTACLLIAAAGTVYFISNNLGWDFSQLTQQLHSSAYSDVFVWDFNAGNSFYKHFISGMFITICMTGLDQDMMQKNLSCKNIREAKKNMYSMSISLIFANILFLSLGALLYMYATQQGILTTNFDNTEFMEAKKHLTMSFQGETSYIRKDELFPFLALKGVMPQYISILFILGLIAAAYSSADSALTALTTSFCIDILGKGKTDIDVKTRTKVHIGFALFLFILILAFYELSNESIITEVFKAAGYTYGPLLGLYTLGIFTKIKINDRYIPIVCILAPIITFLIHHYQATLFGDFQIGFLILIINGCLTIMGLLMIKTYDKRRENKTSI